jgi:hypothetical protein
VQNACPEESASGESLLSQTEEGEVMNFKDELAREHMLMLAKIERMQTLWNLLKTHPERA